jgi:flagellar hook-basal body complex protein FliE
MSVGIIDTSRIEAMVAQLKVAAARTQGVANPLQQLQPQQPVAKPGFADALKASLDQVNGAQRKSEQMSKDFMLGDDKVSLSDMMISMQKASISFQATVQARNKLVSAYHDIMNMQV